MGTTDARARKGRARSQSLILVCVANTLAGVAGAAEESKPVALGEVVVTAQKREATVQDVPLSITALSGVALERAGVEDFNDYAVKVPNLAFAYGYGPAEKAIALRGVYGGDTTGMYLDETPLPVSVDPRAVDLERVEVLRGPQGTLYGARSMGGTVRLITRQPNPADTEFALHTDVSTTKSSGENGSLDASANIPLSERAAVRISGYYDRDSGFIDRVSGATAPTPFSNKDVNKVEQYGGQIALAFKLLDDRLTITPRILTQTTKADGFPMADFYESPTDTNPNPQTLTILRPFDVEEPSDDSWDLYTLTAQYRAAAGVFTSATSWFKQKGKVTEDLTETSPIFLSFLYPDPPPPLVPVTYTNGSSSDDFAQELRFTSDFSGPFQFTLGLFYEKSTSDSFWEPIVIEGISDNVYDLDGHSTVEERAAFTEATYSLTERFAVTAGVRYFKNYLNGVTVESGAVIPPYPGTQTTISYQKEDGFNPKFGLQFALNDDVNFFANAAKGFRYGGSNVYYDFCSDEYAAFGLTEDDVRTFNSDSVWSYEVGAKTRWLDRRLTLNATAFQIDWTDIRQSIVFPNCGAGATLNSGAAESKGFELELAAQATDRLSIGLGVGYTDAKIVDSGQFPGVIAEGSPIQQVPEWNGSAELDYEFNLSSLPMFFHVDYAYVGSSISRFNATEDRPLRPRPSYELVNTRIGAKFGSVEAALYVENVADEQVNYADVNNAAFEYPDRPRIRTNRPRTIGVDMRVRF